MGALRLHRNGVYPDSALAFWREEHWHNKPENDVWRN